MKKKRSYFAGVLTTLVVVAMATTALAVSGQVSFNFANIALDGEQKIASGTTITAPNGQQVPSSILYTDEIGGKTNYFPARVFTELLGVEISYDSATQTVYLGEQPTAPVESYWEVTVTDNQLLYSGTVEGIRYDAPPSFRPTLEVDGLALISIDHNMQNETAAWNYQGTEESVRLWCAYPASASFGRQMNDETAIENAQTLAIDGNTATYYVDKDYSILVWENADGVLFFLNGKNISQELLVEIAQSIKPSNDTVDAHDLDWMPSGYSLMEWYEIADTVQEYWVKDNVTLSWMYAMNALGTPDWDSTTVEVNGVDAQYWEAQDTYYTDSASGDNENIPGIFITSYTKPAQSEMNTLAWQDPHTGVHYRLQSILPQDEMLRMANSVD